MDDLEIDITRPQEIIATCPECGVQRHLPENWYQLVALNMPSDWDGKMRCVKDHEPQIMTLVSTRNTS